MSRAFKLVFLEESEEYITDFGCTVDGRLCEPSTSLPPSYPYSIVKLVKSGQFRGRMRLGSHALYLDLELLDDFIKLPFRDLEEVIAIGSDCVRLKTGSVGSIPVTFTGGKTRLLKPVSSVDCKIEISITLHSSHLADAYTILGSLFRFRQDKEGLQSYVSSLLTNSVVPFDLTSLASHREVLLLTQPMRVIRIKKMIEINGLIQVSKNFIYFQSIPNFSFKKLKRFPIADGKFSANLLKYKLRDSGVEFQFVGGKNLFILFQTKPDRDRVLHALSSNGSSSGCWNQKLPPLSVVTELWRQCSISNFDYLMYLNYASGRSLNDIGQYPIFPWTISNMTASRLDVEDVANYRDFSVPVAAINKAKLEQCRERSLHMAPNERFLFGSFYSNPAFVLYFLIRKFPECHLRLHGGHFDHTARLFTSLKTSWEAVAESGAAMMELIPEFYHSPASAKDWLENPPALMLIPEIELPPWSGGSSASFVMQMRAALESRVVSSKLHEWIDIVFGVKSRGKQICWNANNLFHPICYLQDVQKDVIEYSKEFEIAKDVVVLQSQEFGHVPKQLFLSEPHCKRDMTKYVPVVENGDDWKAAISAAESAGGVAPVAPLAVVEKQERIEAQIQAPLQTAPSTGPTVTPDGYLVVGPTRWRLSIKPLTVCIPIGPDLFLCGDTEGTVFVVSPTEGLLRHASIHASTVTFIAVLGEEKKFCVSGSVDQTLVVWNVRTLESVALLDGHSAEITWVRAESVNGFISRDASGVVLSWHQTGPDCWIASDVVK